MLGRRSGQRRQIRKFAKLPFAEQNRAALRRGWRIQGQRSLPCRPYRRERQGESLDGAGNLENRRSPLVHLVDRRGACGADAAASCGRAAFVAWRTVSTLFRGTVFDSNLVSRPKRSSSNRGESFRLANLPISISAPTTRAKRNAPKLINRLFSVIIVPPSFRRRTRLGFAAAVMGITKCRLCVCRSTKIERSDAVFEAVH